MINVKIHYFIFEMVDVCYCHLNHSGLKDKHTCRSVFFQNKSLITSLDCIHDFATKKLFCCVILRNKNNYQQSYTCVNSFYVFLVAFCSTLRVGGKKQISIQAHLSFIYKIHKTIRDNWNMVLWKNKGIIEFVITQDRSKTFLFNKCNKIQT